MDCRLADRAGLRGRQRDRDRAAVLHVQYVPDPDDRGPWDCAQRCRIDPVADRHCRFGRTGDRTADRPVRVPRGLCHLLADPGRGRAGSGAVGQRILVTRRNDPDRWVRRWRQLISGADPAGQRPFSQVSRARIGTGRDRRIADHNSGAAAAATGDCRELALGVPDAGGPVRADRAPGGAAADAAADRQPSGQDAADRIAARLALFAGARFLAAGLGQHGRRDHYRRRNQPIGADDC